MVVQKPKAEPGPPPPPPPIFVEKRSTKTVVGFKRLRLHIELDPFVAGEGEEEGGRLWLCGSSGPWRSVWLSADDFEGLLAEVELDTNLDDDDDFDPIEMVLMIGKVCGQRGGLDSRHDCSNASGAPMHP